ncbi:hypothetical protein PsalN5692_03742 (plasmid) [Piscirickettsia salmonis]|uniref:hypothetical protein n=1 Tax=Piscirickettsia salmonis TaxID=1238 RepID=UPI0012B73D82|nr:hypothetical protein [Piscirickettsia salmonis]QGP52234.1 hypothetical protein PsalN5692_03742 [Piscirickettsia salmonis]
MKLITIEDYAKINEMRIQDAYELVNNEKLRKFNQPHIGMKRLTLVYVDSAPDFISYLDVNTVYFSQSEAARTMGVSLEKMRKKVVRGEVKSTRMKKFCFIPSEQFKDL